MKNQKHLAQKKADKNSLYTTIFIVLILLIFTVPVASYVALAHQKQQLEQRNEQISKISSSKKDDVIEESSESEADMSHSSMTQRRTTSSADMMDDDTSASATEDTATSRTSATIDDSTTKTYTIQAKDTLYSIARRFGMTPQELMQLNGMTANSKITPGQTIKVK